MKVDESHMADGVVQVLDLEQNMLGMCFSLREENEKEGTGVW